MHTFSPKTFNLHRSHEVYVKEFKGLLVVTPQNPGVLLTTRQPAEYLWMSGTLTPLTTIGQSLLCTGSSTQGTTCPKFSQRQHWVHIQFKMSKNGNLGPCINTHKITYQLYTNSSRVDTSLLIQTYIKI